MRTLQLATAWSLEGFLLNSESEILLQPFGPNEAAIRLRSIDSQKELFVECVHSVSRKQMALLDCYHDMIAGTDQTRISTIKDGAPSGLNPETISINEDIELLRPLINGVSDATYAAIDQFLKTVRWRLGKGFNYKLTGRTGIYWKSLTDENWRRVPSRPSKPGRMGLVVGASLPPTMMTEIQQRLESNQLAPLCFDILMKSRELINTQPSLSLLGAVQAIEIGVKECVGKLCPQAGWLAFEAPTPPVIEILNEYLPTLIRQEETKQLFAAFVERKVQDIRKIIHVRNRIAHKGILVDCDQAQFASDLASEVLYQLDFACGEKWAANFIGYVIY